MDDVLCSWFVSKCVRRGKVSRQVQSGRGERFCVASWSITKPATADGQSHARGFTTCVKSVDP